jgi:hypothetical protein
VSFTLTRTIQVSGNGASLTATETFTEGGNPRLSESIPDSSTNLLVSLAVDVSELAFISIFATGALTVTGVKSGPATEGADLTVSPTKPFTWAATDGTANPWAEDLIGFYIDNASGAAVDLIIETLQDVTP